MTEPRWLRTFKEAVERKRPRENVGFELDVDAYVSWLRRRSRTHEVQEKPDAQAVLARGLRTEVLKWLKDVPRVAAAVKLCNPSQRGYDPMAVVYLAIAKFLEAKKGKEMRKFYTALSKADHVFFLECVRSKEGVDRTKYERLVPIVLREQAAFHFCQQLKIVRDPVFLGVYQQCDPRALVAVDGWLATEKERVLSMGRFYRRVGTVQMLQEVDADWELVSQQQCLDAVPHFDRDRFFSDCQESCFVADDVKCAELGMPPSIRGGYPADAVVSEQTLLALLLVTSDAADSGFRIPLVIEADQERRRTVQFDNPLLQKQMDLRQKQTLYFSNALTARYGGSSGKSSGRCICTSEWKLGNLSVRTRHRDQLQYRNDATGRSTPVKLWAKLEYMSQIYPRQTHTNYEVFTSEALATYWLALFLRRNAVVHVAHVAPKTGKRLKITSFRTCDDVLHVLPSFLQFKPRALQRVLLSILAFLQKQPLGRYLLQYSSSTRDLSCFCMTDVTSPSVQTRLMSREVAEDAGDVVYDLHETFRQDDKSCTTKIPYVPQEWTAAPSPTQSVRIPHTFPFPPTAS